MRQFRPCGGVFRRESVDVARCSQRENVAGYSVAIQLSNDVRDGLFVNELINVIFRDSEAATRFCLRADAAGDKPHVGARRYHGSLAKGGMQLAAAQPCSSVDLFEWIVARGLPCVSPY